MQHVQNLYQKAPHSLAKLAALRVEAITLSKCIDILQTSMSPSRLQLFESFLFPIKPNLLSRITHNGISFVSGWESIDIAEGRAPLHIPFITPSPEVNHNNIAHWTPSPIHHTSLLNLALPNLLVRHAIQIPFSL